MEIINAQNEKLKRHDYTVHLRQGKWDVHVSPTTCYGYFEHDDHGEGGGLWFLENGATLDLVDYDGRAVLPAAVTKALRDAGYTVDDIFD